MIIRKSTLAVALFLSVPGVAFAGECVMQVTRSACPGQEATSYTKCGGKQSCDEKAPAASASQCVSKAKAACANSRLDVTKNKKITATYDGVPVDGGKDFCIGHPDFPYASKPACK